jgi:hypothetical protein
VRFVAEEEVLPPPLEIPWQLAATTQPLAPGEPDETTISLFVFEPDDEEITSLFPDERVVFLKFTTSISPAAFPSGIPPVPGAALGEGVPCFHVLLDLKVRRSGGDPGTIRPYFHAAAPLYRRTIQSGVVGLEVVEGESDEQFVGKSGSQLYESSSTRATTTSIGANASVGIGPFSIGGSARRTTTDVSGERAVSQVVDQTTREASQERRELTSHHTKVENILTLLNAKYVGTPHLRFSLAPRPLQLLSVDPSDPNVWFSQLLQRRSSGIEGIQEYTAVVLVPRDDGFCVNARLRRVCVLDDPPGPLTFVPFSFSQHLGRLLNYVDRAYPVGTPLEELDVDLFGLLPPPAEEFVRPVVAAWITAGSGLILADVVSPAKAPGVVKTAGLFGVNFKHVLELWLETQRDEYERDAARSPLERGVLLGEDRTLDTCFAFAQAGGPTVTSSSASVTPLSFVAVDPADFDLGGITAAASSIRSDTRQRAYEAVTRANLLEERLAVILSNRRASLGKGFTLDDLRLVGVLVELWAKLRPDDPRNLDFEAAVKALHLSDDHRRKLKAAGATDLRGIAQAIKDAPAIARHNDTVRQLRKARKAEADDGPLPEVIRSAISPDDAAAMRRAIGEGLESERSKKPPKKS